MNKINLSWKPDRPASRGSKMYHDAVINKSWYNGNLKPIVKLLKNRVKKADRIVDFGAGTGVSALYLLRHISRTLNLVLVDNSPAWLTKAYEELKKFPNVGYSILVKEKNRYATLSETIGKESANIVISANTVHLIPDIGPVFKGILDSLKPDGFLLLQSGNIKRSNRSRGILMIDDTVGKVHDAAIKIIEKDDYFKKYRKNLKKRIKEELTQRKFIFPNPRPLSFYLKALKESGFINLKAYHEEIKVKYSDWMKFLRIRRIQAGILPEIGGKMASPEEENDRDLAIFKGINALFNNLRKNNRSATKQSFTAEWVYITGEKPNKI